MLLLEKELASFPFFRREFWRQNVYNFETPGARAQAPGNQAKETGGAPAPAARGEDQEDEGRAGEEKQRGSA